MQGNAGMIRDITISARSPEDDQYYELPTRVLGIAVMAGDAHLEIYEYGQKVRAVGPAARIEVLARSLLIALTAAIDDNQSAVHSDPRN